jgi:hypothetical protein
LALSPSSISPAPVRRTPSACEVHRLKLSRSSGARILEIRHSPKL